MTDIRSRTRNSAGPRTAPTSAEYLFDRHGPSCYGLAILMLGNQSDAEDLVYETFTEVLAKIPAPTRVDLYVTLHARVAHRLRARPRHERPCPPDAMHEALAGLDGFTRRAILDAYLTADTTTDIAEHTGATPGRSPLHSRRA